MHKFFYLLLLSFACSQELLSQELEKVLQTQKQISARERSEDAGFGVNLVYPDYDWQVNQSNLKQVFTIAGSDKLPMMWIGEPGQEYRASEIQVLRLRTHIENSRIFKFKGEAGEGQIYIRLLVPHPTTKVYAKLKAIPEFKQLQPADLNVVSQNFKIKDYQGIFFEDKHIGCHAVLSLPQESLVALKSECEMQPQMMQVLQLINIDNFVAKINS